MQTKTNMENSIEKARGWLEILLPTVGPWLLALLIIVVVVGTLRTIGTNVEASFSLVTFGGDAGGDSGSSNGNGLGGQTHAGTDFRF